jgi:hypothetical protein
MNVNSEMQSAERQIRSALQARAGLALHELMQAYIACDELGKDSFVAALIGHLVAQNAVAYMTEAQQCATGAND